MNVVKRLLAILLVLLATYPTDSGAKGVCDKGDIRMGPNCIHRSWVKIGSWNKPFSTVYRVKSKKKVIVWNEEGWVHKSKAAYLIVTQHMIDGQLRCDWQGTRYAEICEEVSDYQ